MNSIIIDTNIILDVLLRREPFFATSYSAMKRASELGIGCVVSASAITDIYYLMHRALKDAAQTRQALERLLQLVDVADVLALDIQAALSSDISDFEDAVVHAVAVRIGADLIMTRNTKDYTQASVPAMEPAKFIARCAN